MLHFSFKTFLIVASIIVANSAFSANQPCSKSKGGVTYCVGEQFKCNDGSFSKSKRACNPDTYGSKPGNKTKKKAKNANMV